MYLESGNCLLDELHSLSTDGFPLEFCVSTRYSHRTLVDSTVEARCTRLAVLSSRTAIIGNGVESTVLTQHTASHILHARPRFRPRHYGSVIVPLVNELSIQFAKLLGGLYWALLSMRLLQTLFSTGESQLASARGARNRYSPCVGISCISRKRES